MRLELYLFIKLIIPLHNKNNEWYPNTFHTQIGLGQKSKSGNNFLFSWMLRETYADNLVTIICIILWNKRDIFYYTNMKIQIQYFIP